MKKAIIILTGMFLQACAVTYQPSEMAEIKRDSDNRIYYEEVVIVKGVKAKEIYNRSLEWVAKNYTSAKDVIQINDPEKMMFIGRGASYVVDPMGGQHKTSHMIKFEAKDQRYRIKLYDFYVYKNPLKDISMHINQERALIKKRVSSLKNEIMKNKKNDNDW